MRVVRAGAASGTSARAAAMLAEELALRVGARVGVSSRPPTGAQQAIVIGLRDELRRLLPEARLAALKGLAAEGFVVQEVGDSSRGDLVVAGNDALGTLFGAGWLLRESRLEQGRLVSASAARAPRTPVRGVQLGYRAVNNTLATWDLAQFERYLRDLIPFGCNTVELTPPVEPPDRSDGSARHEWEMNLRIAELVHSYGLAVSLWLPVTEADPNTPEGRERILANRRQLLGSMTHVDDVFVPGGDPGDTPVEVLLPLLGEMTKVLRASHPGAGMWVSHQGFEPPERDRFYELLARTRPEWLRGVVYGPWTRDSLEHTREAVPAEYGVRAYPDVTHSCRCQYPVPQWDRAYALIEGREVCNPRPEQHRAIFQRLAPHCDGFVLYSDGNHDDANKMLWLSLGWDPRASAPACIEQYGRAFVAPGSEREVRRGLMGLERNWTGPVRRNRAVSRTLAIWRSLHGAHPTNWRVTLHYFRALCDSYVQRRARRDTAREQGALELLEQASQGALPPDRAMAEALRLLDAPMPPRLASMRAELLVLGAELLEAIGLKMSAALGGRDERGDVLDHLDEPLSNAPWLRIQFGAAVGLPAEEQLTAIRRVLAWEDPGESGYYDDLGDPERQPHLVGADDWPDDPDCLRHPFGDHRYREGSVPGRLAWRNPATTLYDTPLQVRYDRLDPDAEYALRVVYAGRFRATMTLTANGRFPVHGPLRAPDPPEVLTFAVPREATAGGRLELTWRRVGCEGRGPQVAELWLVRHCPAL
jgi:hypothetical protein